MCGMRRLISIIVLIVTGALVFVGGQLYFSNRSMSVSASALMDRLDALKIDSRNLKADLEYLKIPENLEKELRSRFNYKKPGEKLIIIVPSRQATTTE